MKKKKIFTLIIDLLIWFLFLAGGLYFFINCFLGFIFSDYRFYKFGLMFCVYVLAMILFSFVWAMVSMALKDYKEKDNKQKRRGK